MNTFLAKIGWKRMRKREIKIIVSFLSYPTRNRKFQKNRKKFKKLNNTIMASLQPKQVGESREREKIKIFIPYRSYPKRSRKYHKNSKKIQKIKKYHYCFILRQNRLENDEKDRK